jgi:hypothetical protein
MIFRAFAAALLRSHPLLLLRRHPRPINSADDETNPPQLGVTEREIAGIPGAKYALIPASEETHGHFTHLRATFWKRYVAEFLKDLPAT